MTIDQQVALDEALVPYASRLRIRKSNFHLRSYITSKELTLQLVYEVLRLTPFSKAFLVTADVPEIYMQEFWATATETLAFFRYLGHSGEIRKITDVNINKLHQPWRSFVAVINKCLSGKSTGYDSLRLSQAQILWGMYHTKNVDFAYLMWEDFVYQVEHKDAKKSNEMYYPRFTKVIIHFFMTKDPSIPRRNKFGAMLPIELTNEDISNSAAYKEYYAIASGATPPKMKASVRKTQSSSDTTMQPPTATTTKKSLQQIHISQASGSGADEGTGTIPGVPDVPTDESDEEISWKSSDEDDDDQDDNNDDQDTDNNGDDFVHPKLSIHEEEAKDEESFDPIIQTPENSNDEGNDDASLGMNDGNEEGQDAEDDDKELYIDININLEGRDVQMTDVHTIQEFEDTHVTLTPVNPDGQQQSSSRIIERYTDQQMNEAIKVVVQLQSDRLQDEAQAENEDFINKLDANIQKIIKEQVKEQVKVDHQQHLFQTLDVRALLNLELSGLAPLLTASESAPAEEPIQTTQDLKEPSHQEFETGAADDQPIAEASQHPECDLAKQADPRSSFNELMDTLVDFLSFLMNRIKVDTLNPELLVGPTYELMKGSCKSLVELEFFLEEVYKVTTDQLDRNNPEGQ
nr:hypothetical protein [Tanacetum cinerariifolium]